MSTRTQSHKFTAFYIQTYFLASLCKFNEVKRS